MIARSYSQHGEDLLVAQRFSPLRGGFFVEVGALDGLTFSNTCLLERNLDWTGVLVEASPVQAALCVTNRPSAVVVAKAVTSPVLASTPMRLEVVDGFEALSSMCITPRVAAIINNRNVQDPGALHVRQIEVPTTTLDHIFVEVGVPESFEFLSIDIEGHEWAALQGLSLGRVWRPQVVLLESAEVFPDSRVVWYMYRNGYGYKRCIGGWNHWYEPTGRLAAYIGVLKLYASALLIAVRMGTRSLLRAAGLLSTVQAMKRQLSRSTRLGRNR